MEGGKGKENLYFALLEVAKRQKGPLGQSVSMNFVSDVANSQMDQYIPFVNLNSQLFSKGQNIAFSRATRPLSKLLLGESLIRGKDALNYQNNLYNINLALTQLTALPLAASVKVLTIAIFLLNFINVPLC